MDGSGDEFSDIDWTTDDELEIDAHLYHPPPVACVVATNAEASSSRSSRSKLADCFVNMGFPEKLVLEVIDKNGEDSNLILSILLTYNTDVKDSSDDDDILLDDDDLLQNDDGDLSDTESCSGNDIPDKDDTDTKSEKHKMLLNLEKIGCLSETDKILLSLANMGYSVEDSSIAMERCGPEASVAEIIDCMLAAQYAREEDCYLPEQDTKPKRLFSGNSKHKKRKFGETSTVKNIEDDEPIRLPNPMIGFGVPSQKPERMYRDITDEARGPPYFYYENVALAPKGVWDTISSFLYNIHPEFVDSKYFCACARKRGYVHNLPIENRYPLVPLPPMTIDKAFPSTKTWWRSWDNREKLSCILSSCSSAKLTEGIRILLEKYGDDPPDQVQKWILRQCRKLNLIWVGKNKVAPLEPDEIEMLLGFPKNHTRGGGISRTDRYKSLGNSFQVDTVAYHLSVLKVLYPNGMNVLTLFSGIGGGEVALHRLGIKLKNVVSVEKSKGNRDIMRSWWGQTNQTGQLIEFDDVQRIDEDLMKQLMDSIGPFDLVIGGSPCNNLAGSNRVSRVGLGGSESALFYDYFRILELVKSIMY